jgi:hypothetical protein
MEEARWDRLAIALRTRLGPPTGHVRPCPQDPAEQPRLRRPPPHRHPAAKRHCSTAITDHSDFELVTWLVIKGEK